MWTKLKYRILFGLCWLVGLLPTWLLYHVLLDILYFFIYKVARYRVKVVKTNLANSFPDKTNQELLRIEKGFYYSLAEIFVDTIDMTSISRKQLAKRMVFEGLEEHEKQVEGKNWIAALAHYGSWEYFGAYQLHTKTQVVGIYHPLHSKVFDMFFLKMRSRFGLLPVKMQDVMRYVISNKDNSERNFALGLISDQTPPRRFPANWHWFLNQKTAYFKGMETLAVKFGMPVYYMKVSKTSRIRYKASFEIIYDGKETIREGEITERYARGLEQTIMNAPQYWMWSHRRWKKTAGMPDVMPFPKEEPESK